MPDGGVTAIGEGAFFQCIGLTSVRLPHGLVSVGDHAFSVCATMASVGFPATLARIGKGAFQTYRITPCLRVWWCVVCGGGH